MRPILVVALVLCCAIATPAQAPTPVNGVAVLLSRLERLLETSDPERLNALLSPNAAPGLVEQFGPRLFSAGTTHAVVREREREPLSGALPGDGFRLVIEALTETRGTARLVTARMDVRRPPGDEAADA